MEIKRKQRRMRECHTALSVPKPFFINKHIYSVCMYACIVRGQTNDLMLYAGEVCGKCAREPHAVYARDRERK